VQKTDILVHDLRAYHGACGRCAEAADEIERLQAENKELREGLARLVNEVSATLEEGK
jgi:hypothetical protein